MEDKAGKKAKEAQADEEDRMSMRSSRAAASKRSRQVLTACFTCGASAEEDRLSGCPTTTAFL